MAQLFESWTINDSTALAVASSYDLKRQGAMTFTPSESHIITSVKLKLYRNYNASWNYTVHLYATSNGVPTGSALVSTSNISTGSLTLDTSGAWVAYNLPSYSLMAGTKYAIVLISGTTASDYWLGWRYGTGTYAGGLCWSEDEGEIWNGPSSSSDAMFEEWGIPNNVEIYPPSASGEGIGVAPNVIIDNPPPVSVTIIPQTALGEALFSPHNIIIGSDLIITAVPIFGSGYGLPVRVIILGYIIELAVSILRGYNLEFSFKRNYEIAECRSNKWRDIS